MRSPDVTLAYQGPLLTVQQWQQPLKNGGTLLFERCQRPDTVAIIAFLDSETILLTQERHLNRTESFLDAPGGRVDAGETHEAAAKRELIEETGYSARTIIPWETTTYKGLIQFEQTIFLAKDLQLIDRTQYSHDATEDIQVLTYSFDELYTFSLKNHLRRPEVMLAVLRMRHDPEAQKRLQTFLAT